MMRVFFMGTTRFSLRCFDAVRKSGQTIAGCASMPETFEISYAPGGVKNVNYVDFEEIARQSAVPCIAFDRKSPGRFARQVKELAPDLIVVAGWYYMVSRGLRESARWGAVGLHGSLLPKYRGGAPLVWTIIHGETRGGVTLFYLDDGVDSGDIIGQKPFPIEANETIADALVKLEEAGVALLEEYLPLLSEGRAPRIPQNHAEATYCAQRSPADGEIDWTKSAKQIKDFIRAQTRPYPGAFTRIAGKKVILWDADLVEEED
jgi:methionyl-tRNA formyltransferase